MAKKSTNTNPALLPFPAVQFALLREAQRRMARAVTSMHADEAKYKAVKESLKILNDFADARFKEDTFLRDEAVAKAQAKAEADAEAAKVAAEQAKAARVAELQAELAELTPAEAAE